MVRGSKCEDPKDRRMNKEVKVVDGLVKKGMSRTEINRLLYIGADVVGYRLGFISKKKGMRNENKKPRCQGGIK